MPSAGIAPRRVVQLAALFAMMVAFIAQLLGALLPVIPLFIAASVVNLGLDLILQHTQPGLLSVLGRIRFDVTVRQLLRDMLILVGLLHIDGINPLNEQAPLTITLLLFYGTHFVCQAVAVLVRRTRALPFVTRNIDASALGLSDAPPRILSRQTGRRLLRFSVPTTTGMMLTTITTDAYWGGIGLAVSLALSTSGTVYLGTWLLPKKRAVGEQRALEWLDNWLAEYRPTVGMYFSGGSSSAYQANMWLSTLADLDGNPIIVLRERFMVQKIEATDIPIVCIPKVANLMRLEHSTLKVLLHPANSGKTSQILRIPSIKHAFTNHGESDKLSSCNPYAKAYDEVWVAGPAARDRYQLADIGVEDKDVVEVGRPQLAPIQPYQGAPAGRFTTVLYAPTWEGWDGNPGNTSVILAGENIVRELLADENVRLLYKPHPMTGSVDPRAGAANARIQAMIAEADERRDGTRPGPEAAAELARRTEELQALTTSAFRKSADELERMRLQSTPPEGRSAAVDAAVAAWEEAYWNAFPEWEHHIVTDARPGIFSCFNQADVLISDVSSVVSDYLSSEKPYAVANTSGMSEDEFRANFPTVRAATILTPEADGVAGLLDAVRDPELDTLAEARAELKEHLLGPSDPPSLVRFNQAALNLCAKADERRLRMESRLAGIPGQRSQEDVKAPQAAERESNGASDAPAAV
ncbi:HupE/UreJ family protein [Streptomyces halobius]|uniref:HupE/UreJ family protein n=1 Tax=Streptomyces halobius TaxID=2879846 RepID=A0ABY4MDM4_9ACTN|nr:HupE/UreJ family protein [Streptomyces halobius]UQA95417.1 HupE/UreJ family protein [Streptomyces halobius]